MCNPQRKNILKSICQWCNNLKLTRFFNGPPNIDLTTKSAIMGGPTDIWFQPILNTVYQTIILLHIIRRGTWQNLCSYGPGHKIYLTVNKMALPIKISVKIVLYSCCFVWRNTIVQELLRFTAGDNVVCLTNTKD